MANVITTKLDVVDWVGCVPLLGTAVGLTEAIYYFSCWMFASLTKQKEEEEIDALDANARFSHQLAQKLIVAADQRNADSKEIPTVDCQYIKANGLDAAFARSNKKCQLLKSSIKFDRMAVSKLDESAQILNDVHNKRDQYYDRINAIGNKFFKGLLRVTWVGAVGIFAYKVYKMHKNAGLQNIAAAGN